MLSNFKKLLEKYSLPLVLIFSFLVRIISLNQSFWLDEATTAQVTKNFSLIEIITKFSPGDFHPPFYYLASKVWSIPFGINEISLKMFSVIFGTLTVFLVYKIAEEIKGKNFGILTALLLATSPLHIYYSQEARMYALQTFFIVLSVFLYQKLLKKDSLKNWFFFALSFLLIGFTDYLPLLIISVFFVHSILIKKEIKWFKKLLFSILPFLINFVFFLPIFKKQLSGGLSVSINNANWWKVLGIFSVKELLLIPLKFITGRISITNYLFYFPIIIPYLIVFSLLVINLKKNKEKILIPLLWFLIPLALTILLSFRVSVLSYFRLLFILPGFYLLLVFSMDSFKKSLKKSSFIIFLILNMIFSSIYLFNPRFHRENWREMVTFIEQSSPEDNAVTLFVSDSQMEAYNYYSIGQVKAIAPGQLEAKFKTVWLMRYVQDLFDPEDKVRIELESLGYIKSKEYDFNGVVVIRYDK
ncbi:glycosyltransferase family 39 protein [Patescibacteria group bacterium]